MPDIDVYKEWLGIPEGDRPPDHYSLLRLVKFEDDTEKIQANYRKLNAHVRKYATGQYLKPSQDLLNELAKAMLCLTDPDAKRDYDESQGREVAGQDGDEPRTVLQYLVHKGTLKRNQVSEIEHFADARGISHRDAVVQMKLANPEQAARALAVELRMPFIDLDDMLPEDDVLDRLPRQVVRRHSCLPLFEDGGKLLVACIDAASPELEDEIRLRFGMPIRPVLALPRSIKQAIAQHYAPGARSEVTEPSPSKTKGKAPAPKAKSKPKIRKGPLSDEEKAQRKQISLIIICWALIGTMLILNFTGLMTELGTPLSVIAGLGVAGIVAGLLKLTYWK